MSTLYNLPAIYLSIDIPNDSSARPVAPRSPMPMHFGSLTRVRAISLRNIFYQLSPVRLPSRPPLRRSGGSRISREERRHALAGESKSKHNKMDSLCVCVCYGIPGSVNEENEKHLCDHLKCARTCFVCV